MFSESGEAKNGPLRPFRSRRSQVRQAPIAQHAPLDFADEVPAAGCCSGRECTRQPLLRGGQSSPLPPTQGAEHGAFFCGPHTGPADRFRATSSEPRVAQGSMSAGQRDGLADREPSHGQCGLRAESDCAPLRSACWPSKHHCRVTGGAAIASDQPLHRRHQPKSLGPLRQSLVEGRESGAARTAIWPFGHSAIRPFGHSAIRPFGRPLSDRESGRTSARRSRAAPAAMDSAPQAPGQALSQQGQTRIERSC